MVLNKLSEMQGRPDQHLQTPANKHIHNFIRLNARNLLYKQTQSLLSTSPAQNTLRWRGLSSKYLRPYCANRRGNNQARASNGSPKQGVIKFGWLGLLQPACADLSSQTGCWCAQLSRRQGRKRNLLQQYHGGHRRRCQ